MCLWCAFSHRERLGKEYTSIYHASCIFCRGREKPFITKINTTRTSDSLHSDKACGKTGTPTLLINGFVRLCCINRKEVL